MAFGNVVLIVDDQNINRVILKNLLENDYELLFAENGQIAMQQLEDHYEDIAVVVLDIVMPVMDGYEVLKAMKADDNYSKIPVVVITIMDNYSSELKAVELGAVDFISRPYEPEIVRLRIKNTIQLRYMSNMMDIVTKDSLTNVYNKETFYEMVKERISEKEDGVEYDILSVDIENFKLINEVYGNPEGDKILKYMSRVLLGKEKEIGGICGRISADHFVMLHPLKGDNLKNAKNFETDFADDFYQCMVSYPIGIMVSPKMGAIRIENTDEEISGLCDRAYLAANEIKGIYNKHISFYNNTVRDKMLLEQQIAGEMRNALNDGEFTIYFQPKIDITTGNHVGAETLVRWEHPKKGLLSPMNFVPLFEKNGFITEMDNYIWNEASSFIARRKAEGKPYVPLSVNVSRRDIYNEKLPQILTDIVSKHGILPKDLHLEITETAYTEKPEQIISVVEKLKSSGFVIEMDDFGSGYSSLNMLSDLPVDVLKLDMKFLQNERLRKKQTGSILNFIISLARWMNLEVVAEGVETREQLDLLRSLECDQAQGYYFAKPMPEEEYIKLLEKEGPTFNLGDEIDKDMPVKIEGLVGGETMLVVDDMSINRNIVRKIFNDSFKIAEAENGKLALEYLRNHPGEISIILLDLIMPEMDGYIFLKNIKKDPNLKDIPIIVASQRGEMNEKRVLKLGADDYLERPFYASVVRKRVSNVMAKKYFENLIDKK